MLNAPLPLVSMSWSRLLLLITVLSFVLASLISILFLDELDPLSDHHQSLHIAHSQLVQPQEQPKKLHTLVAADHDSGNGTAQDEDIGIRLSPLVFGGLAAEEADIEAMEKRVRAARAEQQKTLPQPTSPFTSAPLALANLTTDPLIHLALIPPLSAAAAASQPLPSASHCQLAADTALFSLVVVSINESIASSLSSLVNTSNAGQAAASMRRYTRPAASFFLASPSSLRHIVTDDWELQSSVDIALAHKLQLFATTSDHSWAAATYATYDFDTTDFTLHLLVSHLRSFVADPPHVTVTLPGHQDVTALTFLSFNASSARFMLSRRADVRRFRVYQVELTDAAAADSDGATSPQLVVRQLDEGASKDSFDGSVVIHLLHYREQSDDSRDSVVAIEYDRRSESVSPFSAALYSAPQQETESSTDDLSKPPNSSNDTDDSNSTELAQVNEEATLTTLIPVHTTNTTTADTTTIASNITHHDNNNNNNNNNNTSANYQPPPTTPPIYPPPAALWTLAANPFPRYRAIHSLFPLPPQALIHSSSPSHNFITFASTPFLTTVDRYHHFEPIEIIHLHPNTVFTHLAVNEQATLIALVDGQRDVILLERKAQPAQSVAVGLGVEGVAGGGGGGRGGRSGGDGKMQWEVALELLLPPMLKRLDVLSASIVCINRTTHPADTPASTPTTPTEQPATTAPTTATTQSHPSFVTDRTYLTLLFSTGVLATFALDVDDHDWAGGSGGMVDDELGGGSGAGGVLSLLGVTVLGDAIALNWEFLIGLAVIVFSAVFSLQMNTITRAFQQTGSAVTGR